MERRQHDKVIVFRPLYAVGGQELGFLPGHRAREDVALGAGGLRHAGLDRPQDGDGRGAWPRDLIEVLPLTHIRGRSLHDGRS
jgi:PhoH-like ATPase